MIGYAHNKVKHTILEMMLTHPSATQKIVLVLYFIDVNDIEIPRNKRVGSQLSTFEFNACIKGSIAKALTTRIEVFCSWRAGCIVPFSKLALRMVLPSLYALIGTRVLASFC